MRSRGWKTGSLPEWSGSSRLPSIDGQLGQKLDYVTTYSQHQKVGSHLNFNEGRNWLPGRRWTRIRSNATINGDTDFGRICQDTRPDVSRNNRLMGQHVAEEQVHRQDDCLLQVLILA